MPAKILVVDDEVDTINLLYLTLTRAGYQVLKATSGKAALNIAAQENPDLVILDIMMPDISGIEVLRALRLPPFHAPPVIFFTAKDRLEDVNVGMQAGAFRYLVKPTSREKLLDTVRNALTNAAPLH